MPEKTYLLAFDVLESADATKAVKRLIKDSPDFPHWWNYIPGVFLLTSEMNAEQIADEIRPVSDDANFIVLEIDPNNSQGWLPEKSWEWIKRRGREKLQVNAAKSV